MQTTVKNGVKIIQAPAYDGTRMVGISNLVNLDFWFFLTNQLALKELDF